MPDPEEIAAQMPDPDPEPGQPVTLSKDSVVQMIRHMQEILYMEDGEWNEDKEWSYDTAGEIADELGVRGIGPDTKVIVI